MASRTVRARLDRASEEALALLMREGRNESQAVRIALLEASARRRQRSALREELRRLAADPRDRAQRAAVLADMETLGAAEWPQ